MEGESPRPSEVSFTPRSNPRGGSWRGRLAAFGAAVVGTAAIFGFGGNGSGGKSSESNSMKPPAPEQFVGGLGVPAQHVINGVTYAVRDQQSRNIEGNAGEPTGQLNNEISRRDFGNEAGSVEIKDLAGGGVNEKTSAPTDSQAPNNSLDNSGQNGRG